MRKGVLDGFWCIFTRCWCSCVAYRPLWIRPGSVMIMMSFWTLVAAIERIVLLGEGVRWQIQYSRRLLEVRSTWLWSDGHPGAAANHLYRLGLSVDYHAHLHAQAPVVQCETYSEDSGGHQLRSSGSKQPSRVQSVALAAQTPTIAVAISSVTVFTA